MTRCCRQSATWDDLKIAWKDRNRHQLTVVIRMLSVATLKAHEITKAENLHRTSMSLVSMVRLHYKIQVELGCKQVP